jgi:hypothetical protein
MVCQPVQFRLHQRDQLRQCSVISAPPVAEQLGDLLLQQRGGCHKGRSTLQILPRSRNFSAPTARYSKQKCAILAGFERHFGFIRWKHADAGAKKEASDRCHNLKTHPNNQMKGTMQ